MDDLVSDFVCEAADSLGGLQAGLARLAVDRSDRAAMAEMLRRLHGLKGVCGFVGFARAEALAHAGETLLAAISQAAAPVSAAAVAPLAAMVGRMADLFDRAAEAQGEPAGDDGDLVALIEETAVGLSGRSSRPIEAFPPAALPSSLSAAAIVSDRRVCAPWSGLDTLARALGDRLGKRIELMVGGDDVRIVQAATPPLRTALIAMVRNACDHGIETPSERRAAGKPARALLRLSVHQAQDGATIELSDDGRGVDPALIREGCVASGRLDREGAASLSDAEAQSLIFASGVTTAEAVTALSGRGLGLELVRREVESLGGTVALNSVPGQGARFVIRLPAAVLATPAARSRVAA
ncbi:MAG: hypothetical protein B7Y99_10290 [Caulobacterales bacterium 32-69-10]|nr:MAG: hypothetical protein B7Y99_10290 [Caulobacterales bacterium 32-69-10]